MLNFNDKKGFICDMDGVIYHGNKILPGVPEFIDWLQRTGKEYLFLTNNSGCTPLELKQKLARMGLDVPEARFYTSALATAAFIRDQSPGCSAYVIGEAGLLNALYDAGITMNDVNPDYVIVGEGRNYSLDSLTKATNLVLAGRKAHRRELRPLRPHRKRHRPGVPRAHRAHRDGHRQAGVLLRQAEPADDAHRAQASRLPQRRGRHGR